MNSTAKNLSRCALVLAVCLTQPALCQDKKDKRAKQEPVITHVSERTQRMVIVPFRPPDGASHQGWIGLGTEIGDMTTTAMVQRGADVMERMQLNEVVGEGEKVQSGLIDGDTSEALAKKLGAQIMLLGRITEFGMKDEGAQLGRNLGGVHGQLGQIGLNRSTCRVRLTGRLVDVRSGRILASATGEGQESSGGFSLGDGGIGGWLSGISYQGSEWTESKFGRAASKAVDQLCENLVTKIPGAGSEPAEPIAAKNEARKAVSQIDDKGFAALQRMSIVVLIPEQHLSRPHIPDPAAETEIVRQFLKAGLKVKEDQRLRELREERWVQEAAHGDLNSAQRDALRTRYGADILVTGEGITQRVERDANGDSAGGSTVVCRGRLEVKALRLDTGEIIASDAQTEAGRDLAEAISSKNALQSAAEAVSERLIGSMAAHVLLPPTSAGSFRPSTSAVEIEITGFAGLPAANDLVIAIGKLAGVEKAEMREWRGGTLFATVEADPAVCRKLGLMLATDDAFKSYRVRVASSTESKVTGAVAPAPIPAPKKVVPTKKTTVVARHKS